MAKSRRARRFWGGGGFRGEGREMGLVLLIGRRGGASSLSRGKRLREREISQKVISRQCGGKVATRKEGEGVDLFS